MSDANLISGDRSGFWGVYDAAADLPNVSGSSTQSQFLQIGHLASTNIGGVVVPKICTTATQGAAVWNDLVPATFPTRVFNMPVNTNGANLTAIGTDAAADAATSLYYSEILIPYRMTVTNINVLQGTTVGTDKLRGLLFDSAGAFVIGTATAGQATSGADTFLQIALTAATLCEPGRYYVGVKANGTTDGFQTMSAGSPMLITEKEGSHTFAGNDDITSVPTTFTADVGPIVFLD